VEGVKIEVVPAYNVNKNFHPKANGWPGFIVEIEGVRVYHAGDTDFIPEMKDFQTDITLRPVSGTYMMTADEAVEAAIAIDPGIVIPMHYGSIHRRRGSGCREIQRRPGGKVRSDIIG